MDRKKWMLISVAAVLLIGVVLGILALCGAFVPPVVGLCLPRQESAWNAYYDLLEVKLLEKEYTVERCTVNDDQSAQTQQVQALLDKGCRKFVIQSVDGKQCQQLLRILQQAGASVVFLNEQPAELAQYPGFSYVGFDPAQAGQLQAQTVLRIAHIADHNRDGELCYAVLDTDTTPLRRESCAAALAETDATCLEIQICTPDTESARQRCALLLSRYGKDLEVIFCANDVLAMGALEAIEDGGRKVGRDILLIGADATEQSLELLQQGRLTGTLTGDIHTAADHVLQLLGSREQVIYQAPYTAVEN